MLLTANRNRKVYNAGTEGIIEPEGSLSTDLHDEHRKNDMLSVKDDTKKRVHDIDDAGSEVGRMESMNIAIRIMSFRHQVQPSG